MGKRDKKELSAVNPVIEGVIWKEMLLFFFPLLFGTFFQLLYNTADAVIVGRLVGDAALSAVGGSSAILINVFVGAFTALSSGAGVVIGQNYGAGQDRQVSKAVHTAIAISLIIGTAMTAFGIPLAGYMLRAMNTPIETMAGSTLYLRIYFAGIIPNLLYNMGAGILRAVGDSKRPLYFLIISTLLNIGLDLLFVMYLGMEVAGVALATIICQTISAVLVMILLVRTKESYHVDIKSIRISKYHLKKILLIGIPTAIQSLTYTISNILVQVSINSFGTATVAAWVATGKADQIFWMLSNSLGITITTFVAQNYGAGKMDRVKKCIRQGAVFDVIMTVLLQVFLLTGGMYMLHFFSNSSKVIKIASHMLFFMAAAYLLWVCIEVFAGVLRGLGNTMIPMLINIVGVCGCRVFWILVIMPRFKTLDSLLAVYPISWILASSAFVIYYLCIRRRVFNNTLEASEQI